MRIAIISDTHDNLATFQKAVAFIKKEGITIIIHCGDICSPSTLKEALGNFQGEVHLVSGNMDSDHQITKNSFEELPQVKVWGEVGQLQIDGKKIAFVHFPGLAEGLAATRKYDLVFYGHTHQPWEKKIGKSRLVNPGNVAGLFYKATFAVYDTKDDRLELKILEKLNEYNQPKNR